MCAVVLIKAGPCEFVFDPAVIGGDPDDTIQSGIRGSVDDSQKPAGCGINAFHLAQLRSQTATLRAVGSIHAAVSPRRRASTARNRRLRWGVGRGPPLLNSHGCPDSALQFGHGTARIWVDESSLTRISIYFPDFPGNSLFNIEHSG
jgi:hypothetical protein